MPRHSASLLRSEKASVAPTVALSLAALIAAGGIAFDYARVASMDTELQNAADQAALAAASQLDGQTNACSRAATAAASLLTNNTLFANERAAGTTRNVALPTGGVTNCAGNANIKFYETYDQATDTFGSPLSAGDDAKARFVWVSITPREAFYALTPVVGALRSGAMGAQAIATMGSAICKNPPVMLCNPDESPSNTDTALPYTPTRGVGLRLITGDATVPGNFGWLTAYDANGNPIDGANALKELIGYDNPDGKCQPQSNVTTKPGMTASVLDALNSRFDVYANGASSCPGGGTCSPSVNTRKDLVCNPNAAGTGCQNNATWTEASNPYHPTSTSPLPTDGSQDPATMGYPKDLCHAVKKAANTCGVSGTGNWDRDAYFRVNYKWDHATWTGKPGLSDTMSRFDVYQWEKTNTNVGGVGIAIPQDAGTQKAFSQPATGIPGITTPDRRRIGVAVMNCYALNAAGKTTGPVASWLDTFLVEPAIQRGPGAPSEIFTDQKEVYVEVVGTVSIGSSNAPIIRRDVPYLVR